MDELLERKGFGYLFIYFSASLYTPIPYYHKMSDKDKMIDDDKMTENNKTIDKEGMKMKRDQWKHQNNNMVVIM